MISDVLDSLAAEPIMPVIKGEKHDAASWSVHFAKLQYLKTNRDEVDFGKGGPPNDESIGRAREFLDTLMVVQFLPKQVLASVVGGIGIVMRGAGDKKKVYVEFTNKGSVNALFSDGVGKPVVEKIQPENSAFLYLVAKARDYLDA